MKKILILSLLAIVGQSVFVVKAQAGMLEFFFPSLRTDEPDPSDTLQAPFADQEAQAENPVVDGQLPENALSLDKAHRDVASIREWLVTSSSEVMTFDSEDVRDDFAAHKAYFDEEGLKEYTAFLNDKGVAKALKSGQYKVRSFVEEMPLILNEGDVQGRYRWLFEVSMMVSYMDRDMDNYKNAEPVNQNVVLNIQVGRSPDAMNRDGILIEHWSGKLKKK